MPGYLVRIGLTFYKLCELEWDGDTLESVTGVNRKGNVFTKACVALGYWLSSGGWTEFNYNRSSFLRAHTINSPFLFLFLLHEGKCVFLFDVPVLKLHMSWYSAASLGAK